MSATVDHFGLHLYAEALAGRLEYARAAAAELGEGAAARAWAVALDALTAERPSAEPSLVRDLVALDPATGPACARAVVARGVRAARALDPDELSRWSSLFEDGRVAGDYAELGRGLLAGYRAWLTGLPGDEASLEAAGRRARAGQYPELVLELHCLQALVHLHGGDLERARGRARLAVRMAQAEQLPAQELLAHLTLARVRRHEGQPHLATRILKSIAGYAPPHIATWLTWERQMSGARLPDAPSTPLGRLLDALRRGERLDHALQALREASLPAPLRLDADRVVALLTGSGPSASELSPWRSGETALTPRGLAGLALVSDGPATAVPATTLLIVVPGAAPYRLPPLAMRSEGGRLSTKLIEAPWHPRTERGLAVLAWRAGRPLALPDYFRRVIGVGFDPAVHGSVLSSHIMRARARLGDAGVIDRHLDGLVLTPRYGFMLRDPTCCEATEQQVLRYIGERGGASAVEVARALELPLRTAQRLLAVLVDDGLALAAREGRNLRYDVEDTSFAESTLARMVAALRPSSA